MNYLLQIVIDMEFYKKNVWFRFSPYVVLLIIDIIFIEVTECKTRSEVETHLELGKQFLAKGQLSEALTHYHAAVEGDPDNYLTYYKRGTVYLALGRAKNALGDLDRVLELKPDFHAAKIIRGKVNLKLASYDLAQLDFYNVLKYDPHNAEAHELIQRIAPAKENRDLAHYYASRGEYASAIQFLSEAIELSPWASDLFELRAEWHLENNDILSAVSDIRVCTKLQLDNTKGYFKLASLLYQLGHATDALRSIRECLKLHPEHKDCFPLYKQIKNVEKFLSQAESSLEEKDYAQCIISAQKVLKNENDVPKVIYEGKRFLCTCYTKDGKAAEAISICGEALEMYKDPKVYCDRADAYILSELYEDAIGDFRAALELDSQYERAKEGMEKVKKIQLQAEKRDYYKILEVDRTATKKEITKAYRKQAQKWHPDNFQNDEKMKKIAEKKFIDIAAAKEVLTNEEKRRQFDNGDDPLDPESGRSGMPNFQNFQGFQGFHGFQGSPFQFRFNFN